MKDIVEIFIPSMNKIVTASKGERLLDILWDNHIEINSFCGGNKSCGKCLVRLLKGYTNPITDNEKEVLSKKQIDENIILACEHYVLNDIEIEILGNQNTIKDTKSFYNYNIESKSKPLVEKINVILDTPSIKDSRDDIKRIIDKLDKNIEFDPSIIKYISDEIRKEDYNITAILYNNKLIGVESGNTVDKNYAIVIDLGTTTIAGYLININKNQVIQTYSYGNLQKIYGADVISRISYLVNKKDGLEDMSKLAIESIDYVINKLVENSSIDYKNIYLTLVLGNTVMSHILIKANPSGISKAPFTPVFTNLIKSNTKNIGISSTEDECNFILLPNIAGYVGSDTIGVIISTCIDELKGNWLAIDIGTNCELVLKYEDKILACSTAAGPAFEGACMRQGMRAESGAIYDFYIDIDDNDISIDISTIGESHPVGVCGSGYIDIVAQLLKVRLINKNGRLLNKEKLDTKIPEELKGRIVKSEKGNKFIISKECIEYPEVAITQNDISQLQLAKGAVRAAIEILLRKANIKEDELDGILLAGAFGSNINIDNSILLGIIPNIDTDKIKVVGNAAGSGGIKVVLSEDSLKKAEEVHSKIEHIELSLHNDFSSLFAKGMIFNCHYIEKLN